MSLRELQYPIGEYEPPSRATREQIDGWINRIETLPSRFRAAVEPLSEPQLDTPYRPGGWTVRQLVHHVPDSHLNSYIRFKWALTEERPAIKAYHEDRWAELADSQGPVATSLDLLTALHRRWVSLLRSLDGPQLERELVHPDLGPQRLDIYIGLYAWHGDHHLVHVENLVAREGW